MVKLRLFKVRSLRFSKNKMATMNEALKILKSCGLISARGPDRSVVDGLSLKQMVDIANELDMSFGQQAGKVKNPFFSYAAALHMGGDSAECFDLDCRMRRINKLARYAALYSDTVYIPSYFSKYTTLKAEESLPTSKQRFFEDLQVISEIRPLIERDFIRIFPIETHYCFGCQANALLGEGAKNRFTRQFNRLKKTYLENMRASVSQLGATYLWRLSGPAQYMDHAVARVQSAMNHPVLSHRPRIAGSLRRGKTLKVSKTLLREMSFHWEKAHEVARNALYGLTTSRCLNTSFLTGSDIHVSFLNSLQQSSVISRQNIVAANHLASIIPFAEDVSLTDIITLRNREEEAFVKYRQALKSAIAEFVKPGAAFTEKEARELHADVIAPSLAALDIRVKRAKRDLISKPLRSVSGVVGSLSFGMLTGLVSSDISAIAKAIGIVGFGAKFIADVMALGDSETAIADEHLYFLWKVKKKGGA